MPLYRRNDGRQGRGVRHRHPCVEQYDRALYHDALSPARYAKAQEPDSLRLLGLHLWRDHHRHRACPGGHRLPGADALCQVPQSAGADEPVQRGGGHQNRRSAQPPHADAHLPQRGCPAYGNSKRYGAGAFQARRCGTRRSGGCLRGQYAQDYLGWAKAGPRPARYQPRPPR